MAAQTPAVEQTPAPVGPALQALGRCALRTAALLASRRIHLPAQRVGQRLRFADGTTARVYRETVVDRGPTRDPAVLVVCFRLRHVHGRGHTWFRVESLLNTPLFVGFPGFVSKLWLEHDEHDVYRGLYEWDGPDLAESYVRCLWHVLALVSVKGSIHYQVLPGLRRDELLRDPAVGSATRGQDWAQLTRVEPRAA